MANGKNNDKFKCPVCGGCSKTGIDSYKHTWVSCNDCGNVFRKRKERYLFSRLIPHNIARMFLSDRLRSNLYAMEDIREDESLFYDYYASVSATNVEETKWAPLFDKLRNNLGKYGVDMTDKKVLDISGGPGFLTREIAKIAKKAVVTEYSQVSVDGMIKNLGINAVKFDYNTDDLSNVVSDKFDIIIIEYSINFCTNLKKFVASLREILNERGVVYVSFCPPTLGCCIRWQFDEYTYNILYQPETMAKIFQEEGFSLISGLSASWPDNHYSYSAKRPLMARLSYLPYVFLARAGNKSINRELIQKSFMQLFMLEQKQH